MEDESLYNAWERFKQLIRRCPMHGIEQMTQMDIFYDAMNYSSKGIVNEALLDSGKVHFLSGFCSN